MPKQPGGKPPEGQTPEEDDLQLSMPPKALKQDKEMLANGEEIGCSMMAEVPCVKTLQEAVATKNGLIQPVLVEQYLMANGEIGAKGLAEKMELQISNTNPASPGIKENLLRQRRLQDIRKLGDYWVQIYHAVRQYQPAYLKTLHWDTRYVAVLGLTAAGCKQKAREEQNPLARAERIIGVPDQKNKNN